MHPRYASFPYQKTSPEGQAARCGAKQRGKKGRARNTLSPGVTRSAKATTAGAPWVGVCVGGGHEGVAPEDQRSGARCGGGARKRTTPGGTSDRFHHSCPDGRHNSSSAQCTQGDRIRKGRSYRFAEARADKQRRQTNLNLTRAAPEAQYQNVTDLVTNKKKRREERKNLGTPEPLP